MVAGIGEKLWRSWKSTKGQRGTRTHSIPFRFLHTLSLYTSIQCDDKKRARQKMKSFLSPSSSDEACERDGAPTNLYAVTLFQASFTMHPRPPTILLSLLSRH